MLGGGGLPYLSYIFNYVFQTTYNSHVWRGHHSPIILLYILSFGQYGNGH